MIKVLIVDDSSFMCIALRKMLERDPNVRVVGEARDGAAGLNMARELRPDVITMDVEMPVMDGLEATRQIMASVPCPIIMVSSLTLQGAVTTIKAMEIGAVDFISKSSSFVQLDIANIERELLEKVNHWARQGLHRAPAPVLVEAVAPVAVKGAEPKGSVDLIVVGVSTGGPKMLPQLLHAMGRLRCPVVIAQHMPAVFTAGMAQHLGHETGLRVIEGHHGLSLEPGMVVIAPGAHDSQIRRPFQGLAMDVGVHPEAPIRPWVDLLFESAVSNAKNPVAVILTGMGNDGTRGGERFARNGLPVLVQQPETCVVAGMPGAAIKAGIASDVLTVEQIGAKLSKWAG